MFLSMYRYLGLLIITFFLSHCSHEVNRKDRNRKPQPAQDAVSSSGGQFQDQQSAQQQQSDDPVSQRVGSQQQQRPQLKFWSDPSSAAARDAARMQPSNGPDARRIRYIAEQGGARWYGDWSGNITRSVAAQMQSATQQNAAAVMVAYNIPGRDCGSYSAGGAPNAFAYRAWINDFAKALGSTTAIIILEPDALAHDNCLTDERYDLIRYAITTLKARPNTLVYIDAGHSAWIESGKMAERLLRASVELGDGFALNVSNYQHSKNLIDYGKAIRSRGVSKNFVIDTSRNGNGPTPTNEWCNPAGRALGQRPAFPPDAPTIEGLDGYLWVKVPGESDGPCNGGPGAGGWWREKALELARNAGI
jgi:endoglucanase